MTKPLDWNQVSAERAINRMNHMDALRALETREDWDILPAHVKKGGPQAVNALYLIAQFGHRGWLDTLMELEAVAHRHNVLDAWRAAVESCVGSQGPAMADADVRRGLSRSNTTLIAA